MLLNSLPELNPANETHILKLNVVAELIEDAFATAICEFPLPVKPNVIWLKIGVPVPPVLPPSPKVPLLLAPLKSVNVIPVPG